MTFNPLRTTPRPSILRELGNMERWFSLMDQKHSNHFLMVAEITGQRPSMSACRIALDALQARHPLLNVCLEQEGEHFYFRQMDARIPMRRVPRNLSLEWKAQASRELADAFDTTRGPLLRATFVLGQDHSEVLLTAHHAIADGIAVTFLMRDLLHALSGEALDSLPMPLSQESLFAPMRTAEAPAAAPPDTSRPTIFEGADAMPPQLHTLRLSPAGTADIIRKAREEGTTVHAAIVAAAVLAGRNVLDSWRRQPVRIFSPVSLRPILGLTDEFAVAVTCAITALDASSLDLWQLARSSKQQLLPQQQADGIANGMDFIAMSIANNGTSIEVSEIAAATFGCELMVTNIGRVSFESGFGSLTLKALWGPFLHQGYEAEQTIGVTTVNGSLCLSYTSVAPIPGLLASIATNLSGACSRSMAA